MSKIFLFLLVIFIPQLLFIQKAQAVSNCVGDVPILTYNNPKNGSRNTKTFFPENSGDLTLRFTLLNNVANNIIKTQQSKFVYLRLSCNWFGSCSETAPVEVTPSQTTFDLTIPTASEIAKKGEYSGSIMTSPDATKKSSTEECYGVKYQVGLNSCQFVSAPNSVAPGASFWVTFYGKADNANYQLTLPPNINGGPGNTPFFLDGNGNWNNIKTNSQGGGRFENMRVNKYEGNKFLLKISNKNDENDKCFSPLIVSLNAPEQPPYDPNDPLIPGEKLTVSFGTPASGGAENCNDRRGTAIKTAIGCVHTSPYEFVKDFITFIVGISGGIAFLMMLLGAFQMLTSAGNPETLNAGRDRLTSAVIGLLFIIFSVLLLQIIGFDILKIPGFGR